MRGCSLSGYRFHKQGIITDDLAGIVNISFTFSKPDGVIKPPILVMKSDTANDKKKIKIMEGTAWI